MKRIRIITTGGTIASVSSAAGGAIPTLKGENLLDAIPGVRNWADVTIESAAQTAGSHLGLDTLLAIARRANEILDGNEADGIVVTQGTDTIDENAYLLDLTVTAEHPVVVTGAMRNPSMLGAEGPKNLHDALRVAASPESRGRGTLVVFNDEIHSARGAQKGHTQSTAAFSSPVTGPMGCVLCNDVHFYYTLKRRSRILPPKLDKRVEILKLGIEPSVIFLRACLESDVRGVVIEGLGGGRFPPYYTELLREAVGSGRAVVVTSRTGRGRIWDPYGYEGAFESLRDIGVIFGHDLSSPKLRIKVMLALANLGSLDEIREYVEHE